MKAVFQNIKTILYGILNSYSQVFFSNDKIFALILLIASFLDPMVGLSGLIAIFFTQLTAYIFSYNKTYIKDGSYSYNSLLVGLVIGYYYQFNVYFIVILLIASVITFFLTIWLASLSGRYRIPFLSLPFLIAVWIVLLGATKFSAFVLKPREILSIAELNYTQYGYLQGLMSWLDSLAIPGFISIYLKSVGAILFQYNLLAGIVIIIGLLWFSRIAFVLSLFGYTVGYLFYYYMEGDFSNLIYSYIGFNYILTAIALGGFFVVPSRKSFILVFITIPIIALLINALTSILNEFNLPLYSLPFNIVVLLFLIGLQKRLQAGGLNLVVFQEFSPEKNHYKHFNRVERFSSESWYHIALPFMGEWHVSQGQDGKITHKGEWADAWDFDIKNEKGKTYKKDGDSPEDYYCYNLPVLAPAGGYVVKIEDDVEDNKISKVNLENNWGNTIIIQHGDYLYSKLCHLKKNSFRVKVGDFVKKGEHVANCGNSGRSPEPHLHFQLQANPYIGSKTLKYPLSYYITKIKDTSELKSFAFPKEGDIVSNIETAGVLQESFNLIPGEVIEFEYNINGGKPKREKWEIFTDAYNYSYIYCHSTNSCAYFTNNKTMFMCTDFSGDTRSLLYYFFLGTQRVMLGYYPLITLKDKLIPTGLFNRFLLAIHDFTAPLFHYLKVEYSSTFEKSNRSQNPTELSIIGTGKAKFLNMQFRQINVEIVLKNNRIDEMIVSDRKKSIKARCTDL